MLPDYALTLTCEAATAPAGAFAAGCRAALARLAPFASRDLFLPHPDHGAVPFFADGPPPAAILEVAAFAIDPLLAAAGDLAAALAPLSGAGFRAGLFAVARQPVGGDRVAEAREAAMSFVVRYYGPTEDPAAFAAHYVANHPPILARFPAIRNVLCYVPLPIPISGFESDPCIIRNEVVFDDVPTLVAALRSPVLTDLRADSKAFAAFGRSTHHAMVREAVA
jgi:uncharacterized protein (TIGR02118 family)